MTALEEIEHIARIAIDVEVQLDSRWMKLSEILALEECSIIEMNRSAGENIDIYIGENWRPSVRSFSSRTLWACASPTSMWIADGKRAMDLLQSLRRHRAGARAAFERALFLLKKARRDFVHRAPAPRPRGGSLR